ncbi:hypothetical protein JW905_06245 [bacterium]|nr:hypothetical protein [candidate division CSSED10-310 bacterium]
MRKSHIVGTERFSKIADGAGAGVAHFERSTIQVVPQAGATPAPDAAFKILGQQ